MDCAVSNAIGRIDMGIDMHEFDWRVRSDRLENREAMEWSPPAVIGTIRAGCSLA